MGNKKKFDKIERNETYYDAYGEDNSDAVKEDKKKKKSLFGVDGQNVPESKSPSSRFTYTREKRKVTHEQEAIEEVLPVAVSPFVFSLIVLCLVLAMGFALSSDLFLSLAENVRCAAEALMYFAAYVVPSVIYLVISHKRCGLHYVRRFAPSMIPFSAAMLGLVFCLTALQKYFIAYAFSYSDSYVLVSESVLVSVLLGAVLPAVCEELFVHGVLQYEVSKYAGGLGGILFAALVFAMLHFELQYFFVYFVAGLVMGALTHVTRSVFPAMLVHFLNNLLSILFSERLDFIATERIGGTLLMMVIAALCFGFLILCLNLAEKISGKRAAEFLKRTGRENSETVDEEDGEEIIKLCADGGKSVKKLFKILACPPVLVSVAVFVIVVFAGLAL